VPQSTVGYEKRFNPSIEEARRGEEAFVRHILEGQPEPPPYFARMKKLNREGVPLLGGLPRLRHIGPEELCALAGRTDIAVVDTRPDRSAFMRAHLRGALSAPLNRDFSSVIASYTEPEMPVYLIVEETDIEDAIVSLVRVGVDQVVGFATPADLAEIRSCMGEIEEISAVELEARRCESEAYVLDVRTAEEYRASHVPGAHLIPHVRLLKHMQNLPQDRKLLVHCRTGNRSAAASSLLARHGFDVVYVNGLFSEWEAHVFQTWSAPSKAPCRMFADISARPDARSRVM
jgi:hydroxyacylglutathione hydrolase